MKKILTASLLFCMIMMTTVTTVFATDYKHENKMESISDGKTEIVPYNMDVWSTNGLPLYVSADGLSIQVNPGAGKNLKVHFYLSKSFLANMRLTILLSTGSGYRTIAYWNTEGDHWADVVTNTSNTTYYIRIVGPAYINGAFYTEP